MTFCSFPASASDVRFRLSSIAGVIISRSGMGLYHDPSRHLDLHVGGDQARLGLGSDLEGDITSVLAIRAENLHAPRRRLPNSDGVARQLPKELDPAFWMSRHDLSRSAAHSAG